MSVSVVLTYLLTYLLAYLFIYISVGRPIILSEAQYLFKKDESVSCRLYQDSAKQANLVCGWGVVAGL